MKQMIKNIKKNGTKPTPVLKEVQDSKDFPRYLKDFKNSGKTKRTRLGEKITDMKKWKKGENEEHLQKHEKMSKANTVFKRFKRFFKDSKDFKSRPKPPDLFRVKNPRHEKKKK